jgi:hypothetical protein
MYPGIIHAVKSTIYAPPSKILVVNTSSLGDFRPDISVADYEGTQLLYYMRYFIELKLPKNNLLTSENCGQVLDYFNKAQEKQPYRSHFVAILSNFTSACVFTAEYRAGQARLSQRLYRLSRMPLSLQIGILRSTMSTFLPSTSTFLPITRLLQSLGITSCLTLASRHPCPPHLQPCP